MKTIICLIIIAVTMYAQADDLRQWTAAVTVVDDAKQPVKDAHVTIYYDVPRQLREQDSGKIVGLTDTNGVFTASHHGRTFGFRFIVEKSGYYSDNYSKDFYGVFSSENLNPNLNFVLKKIIKPIPMYAKSLNTHVPDLDKPVGYDFEVGDWVGPYGKGINADILFTGHFDKCANGESDFTLTVSFPNRGDGIQEFHAPALAQNGPYSGLRSSQEAPADGYQSKWVQTDNRGPSHPIETSRDPSRNYYFRVRTKMDEKGNIVSAHYGKIYGDFMEFKYYLNPTINDRNVEFDPKQNLMTNLKFDEGVSQP